MLRNRDYLGSKNAKALRMSEKSGGLFTQNKQTVPGVSACIKESKKKEQGAFGSLLSLSAEMAKNSILRIW
jgi:hypothetical protein